MNEYKNEYKEERTIEHEPVQEQHVATYKVTQLIWLLLGLLEAVLAIRVVFKLIGVNAANSFATLLYNVTDLFVKPFASLTGAPAAGGSVLEISTIIAMIVYLLLAWALARIMYVLFYRPRGPVSVRQTVVSDRTTPLAPLDVSQKVTTERTTTQSPSGANQTTVIERTNTKTPGSL